MALTAGTRLGPYEIVAPIGAGGMGEVYRARDARLERTVAIKVLPEHLADNAQRRERFEREAKTVSGLNHPHICSGFSGGHSWFPSCSPMSWSVGNGDVGAEYSADARDKPLQCFILAPSVLCLRSLDRAGYGVLYGTS